GCAAADLPAQAAADSLAPRVRSAWSPVGTDAPEDGRSGKLEPFTRTDDMSAMDTAELEQKALAKTWFYPFPLPSGVTTPTYDGGALDLIHTTRTQMLDRALDAHFGGDFSGRSAVDMACHQGWFSMHLSRRGFDSVLGIDARDEHVADAGLIRDAMRLSQWSLLQSDI